MATGVALTHLAEKALLNYMLRNTATGGFPPAVVYVGLFSTAPGDQGGGTEVSGGSYARQSVAFAAPTDNGASSGSQTASTADIVFPAASADWGAITAVGLFDAVSGGTLLMYGNLSAAQTVNAGNQFVIPAGSLSALLD
jgi:hypothetical protein